MVRQLKDTDKAEVLAFAKQDPAINLFLLGDVENFGVENDMMTLWGQFDGQELTGVLLRYYEFFMAYYLYDCFKPEPFINVIKAYKGKVAALSGKGTVIDKFVDKIPCPKIERTYFCKSTELIDMQSVDCEGVRLATLDDIDTLFDLLSGIKEFTAPHKGIIENTLRTQLGRIYMITDEKGEAIAIAQTTAENSISAMIVGVCTRKDHRKKGLMRKVMLKLCNDLQQEGKMLCLFYSNKAAGKTYHNLGFKTIGTWTMMKFDEE